MRHHDLLVLPWMLQVQRMPGWRSGGGVVVRPQRAGPILPTVIAIMSQQTAATRIIAAGKPSFFLHKELDTKIV
jgi:hypothetical protein